MVNLLIIIIIISSFVGVVASMHLLIQKQPRIERRLSVKHFLVLIMVYLNVTVGFGVVYIALELLGVQVIKEGTKMPGESLFHLIEDALYFSAVTLLTVGYGDIIPQGIGRWIAILQALIGYLLPAAFVVTSFVTYDDVGRKRSHHL
jgi:potassium channel LctB